MEQGLTSVPETPPGCQMDLFFRGESHKTSITQDFWQVFGSVAESSTQKYVFKWPANTVSIYFPLFLTSPFKKHLCMPARLFIVM